MELREMSRHQIHANFIFGIDFQEILNLGHMGILKSVFSFFVYILFIYVALTLTLFQLGKKEAEDTPKLIH